MFTMFKKCFLSSNLTMSNLIRLWRYTNTNNLRTMIPKFCQKKTLIYDNLFLLRREKLRKKFSKKAKENKRYGLTTDVAKKTNERWAIIRQSKFKNDKPRVVRGIVIRKSDLSIHLRSPVIFIIFNISFFILRKISLIVKFRSRGTGGVQ